MNLKIKLLKKELELEELKEKKKPFLQNQDYKELSVLREQEEKIESEIQLLVCELKVRFDLLEIREGNYAELKELSLFLFRYDNKNNLLTLKISEFFQSKILQKQTALFNRDFKKWDNIKTEISNLKKQFSEIKFSI
ncbi:MAG: hypothetical protein PHC38_11595 [Weeksellaceae bacterium]|nr:hypothetical protein [Weeksellaceae bacterium]